MSKVTTKPYLHAQQGHKKISEDTQHQNKQYKSSCGNRIVLIHRICLIFHVLLLVVASGQDREPSLN